MAVGLEARHEPAKRRAVAEPLHRGQRDRQRLLVVVAQHQMAHFLGHRGEQRIALRAGQATIAHGRSKRDLDVDLDVGGVDAGRVVDGVRVAAAAIEAEADAALLGNAQVSALADDAGADLFGRHTDGIVGAVADFRIRFVAAADVGADAAEP
ncbi:hypothetical protein D9M72_464270 [compost metagenome]